MVQDWLNQNAPGYAELNTKEKQAVMEFSLLWSLFEGLVLDYSANVNTIKSKMETWEELGLLGTEELDEYKQYFTRRYIEDGQINDRFTQLHFRNSDNSALVERVLKDETDSASEIITALLIIVFRYRNNFFHGYKWAYGFADQLNNFNKANELLIQVLKINNEN